MSGTINELIANGFPLWGGSQLAVDTTLVSPLPHGQPAAAVAPLAAQPCQRRAVPRNALTLNLVVHHGVAWCFWTWRLAAARYTRKHAIGSNYL